MIIFGFAAHKQVIQNIPLFQNLLCLLLCNQGHGRWEKGKNGFPILNLEGQRLVVISWSLSRNAQVKIEKKWKKSGRKRRQHSQQQNQRTSSRNETKWLSITQRRKARGLLFFPLCSALFSLFHFQPLSSPVLGVRLCAGLSNRIKDVYTCSVRP